MEKYEMKKLLASFTGIALAAAMTTTAYAKPLTEEVILPDGSKVELITNKKGGFIAPSSVQSLAFHCPTGGACKPIEGATKTSAGSSGLGIVAKPIADLGVAGIWNDAVRHRATDQETNNTTVVQSSSSGAVAVADPVNVNNNTNIPIGVGLGGEGGNAQTVGAGSCNTGSFSSAGCQ
ncbi:MAG: hypothetical protein ABA06_04260 [Parcubacteria bacterium C7867-001]|nr:MAG: hypothetical protein ABA06_04260 [Parcubacteria bacterium C7867-001]